MNTTTKTQREFHLKSRPEGVPRQDNFELVEAEMPEPGANQFLVQNEWLSVDPYMRGRMREGQSYAEPFQIGEPMEGGCVGKVIQSNNDEFREGDYVLGNQGWREFWVSDGQGVQTIDSEREGVEIQNYLSVLGLTGMTAYVGLLKIGSLNEGETVFVSAASGAVGSIVCQIAKIKNCRVVGSAGSSEKIKWLKDVAGIDEAFNYHDTNDVSAKLKELCPDGIDVYFDNVGGDHLKGAIDNMTQNGRIVCCGAISGYNDKQPRPGPNNLFKIIGKRLHMQGFIVRDHYDLQEQFVKDMGGWIREGKINWEETVTEGLDKTPEAFINLFNGDKLGKALIKV